MTQEITQRTALCGILLHPAAHTRSPAMHNAAFAHLDIDAVYVAFDVPGARLGEAIRGARALALRQLAISIPHKESVIEHLDEIDATAQRIGAVNTVTLRGERLAGSNTDWVGAVCALERADKLDGKNAVVLGAGGTARAVVYGLLERGARVTVLNRTRERAVAVAEALGADGAGSLTDLGTTACDVLVNATSVGLRRDASPVPADAVPADALVLDAVYDPEDTRLLRDAAARGARTISGKWMLIHQAAEQLRLWTGREAPIEVMERAYSTF